MDINISNENEISLRVVEFAGSKEVAIDGTQFVGEDEDEIEKVLELYEDVLISLYDIDQKYEDEDKYWKVGELLSEEASFDDRQKNNLRKWENMGILKKGYMDWSTAFYETFEFQEYSSKDSWITMGQLCTRSSRDPKVIRKAYNNLKEYDRRLTESDARVWTSLPDDSSTDDIVDVVRGNPRYTEKSIINVHVMEFGDLPKK